MILHGWAKVGHGGRRLGVVGQAGATEELAKEALLHLEIV